MFAGQSFGAPPANDIVVTDPLLHLSCGDDEPP
jgi:hypothetical protein